MTPRRRLQLALMLGVVIVMGLLAVAARNLAAYRASSFWVDHTQEVERELSLAVAAATAAQSSVRGYLLYGQEELLGRSRRARAELSQRIDRIAELTADNVSQGARIARLRPLVTAMFAAEDALLLDRAARGPAMAAEDAVQALFAEMTREEERLLLLRSAGERDTGAGSLLLTAIVIAVLALAVAALWLRARRELDEHDRAAEEVANARRFLDTVIESLPLMIFIKDAERLAFTRMNRAGEALLGVGREKLLGKNDFDFFPADQARFFQEKDRSTLAGKAQVEIEEEPIETARGRRWLHTRKVPILDEAGEPRFLLGISEDITARKEAQEELRAARDKAEATSRELEAFSYSVSHDLRAPLRAIDGFSQALLEDHGKSLDETAHDYLERVRKAAQRMGQLIDDLLELSRVSRHELRRQPVDLSALAKLVASALREEQPDRAVEVRIESGLSAGCDPRLLRVVFENLLGNAFKFTARKPSALIVVGAREGAFFVQDDGAGFDMRYSDKLFGAFQRLHAKHEFEGTGIGLATVQRIVHRHGGRIWAQSAPGSGATFFFTLG